MPEHARPSQYPGIFAIRIINAVVGLIEIVLLIRLLLELFGASAASQFVAWIYGVSGTLIAPFAGAFPGLMMGQGSSLDIVAILAMIGYAIIGWLVVRAILFIFASLSMP